MTNIKHLPYKNSTSINYISEHGESVDSTKVNNDGLKIEKPFEMEFISTQIGNKPSGNRHCHAESKTE